MTTTELPNSITRRLATEIAQLRRDTDQMLRSMRSTQLSNSSIEDGALVVRDEFGNIRNVYGRQEDGTFGETAQNAPVPPPRPNAAIVTSIAAGIKIEWNGAFVATRPLDFQHIEIHVLSSPTGIPGDSTMIGTMSEAGSWIAAPLDYNSTYYVVFIAVNTSKLKSEPSLPVAGQPTMVVAQSVLDGIVGTLALANDAVTNAKIAVDAVDGTKIADNSISSPLIVADAIQTLHIATGAVSANEIAANAITADKLNALAVTADKIAANAINAGHITAGAVTAAKLESILSISSRFIAGSPTGTRAEMNSGGFEAWNGALQTFDVNGANGDVMMLGTYRSAAVGQERVEIVKNGTMRYYATGAGTGTYAQIQNVGGSLLMRGVLNGSHAANIVLDTGNAGFNYGIPGGATLTGVGVSGNFFGVIASFSGHRLNGQVSPDSNGRRHFWIVTNSSGSDIGSTLLQYNTNGEATARPNLNSPTNNCGITWGANEIWITTGALTGFGPVAASVFNVNSGIAGKENVAEVEVPDGRSSWDAIEGAPAMGFDYIEELEPRPEKPKVDGSFIKMRVRNPEIPDAVWETLPENHSHKWIYERGEWTAPANPNRRHVFPVAEDLKAVGVDVVSNFTGEPTGERVDLRDMVGLLWDAVDMLIKRNRILENQIADSLPKFKMPPRPQRGDLVEGVGAIAPGRTKRDIDAATGQAKTRVKDPRGALTSRLGDAATDLLGSTVPAEEPLRPPANGGTFFERNGQLWYMNSNGQTKKVV